MVPSVGEQKGSHILSTLLTSPNSIAYVEVIARRSAPATAQQQASQSGVKLTEFVNADTAAWTTHISSASRPAPSILFSSLATTRANAGSLAAQYKLEHDLNIALARAARDRGTKVYVLISSGGASQDSWNGYLKMKGDIEEHIKELDFERTVILRPGLIGGKREESRPMETALRTLGGLMGKLSGGYLKDMWIQDADVIARAACRAGVLALHGEGEAKEKGKVWVLGQNDILRLGRDEWKGL